MVWPGDPFTSPAGCGGVHKTIQAFYLAPHVPKWPDEEDALTCGVRLSKISPFFHTRVYLELDSLWHTYYICSTTTCLRYSPAERYRPPGVRWQRWKSSSPTLPGGATPCMATVGQSVSNNNKALASKVLGWTTLWSTSQDNHGCRIAFTAPAPSVESSARDAEQQGAQLCAHVALRAGRRRRGRVGPDSALWVPLLPSCVGTAERVLLGAGVAQQSHTLLEQIPAYHRFRAGEPLHVHPCMDARVRLCTCLLSHS